MTAKYKVVDTDNLRAEGAVIPPSIKTTVTIGDKYFDGTKMVHLDGCGDVAALDGLAGIYWNLKAVDILIMDINEEAIRLPSAGILSDLLASPTGYNYNIEPDAEYNEHGAHYAIGALALIMLLSLKVHIPEVVTGLIGIALIALSVYASISWSKKALVPTANEATVVTPPRLMDKPLCSETL